MKHNSLLMVIFAVMVSHFSVFSENDKNISVGIKVMFGGRYDNMRMCVASDSGVKGGIIADVMLLTRFKLNSNTAVVFELPVMRPILFVAAFKMLQLEPQFTLEFTREINDNVEFVFGPGIGLSLHYGPDYHSEKNNRGASFFAAGPLISGLFGFNFNGSNGKRRTIGLRPFYIPLFSGKSSLSPGTVLGGVIEGQFDFK